MTNANERQVGGDHYKTGGIELWDLFGPESIIFYASRYLQRWRKKNGVIDLEKALHCVQKLREIAPHHAARNVLAVDDKLFESWLYNTVIVDEERSIIRRLVIWWKDDAELEFAQRQIEYLIKKESSSLELVTNDDELATELARLEAAQAAAPGWGAAVGVRGEYIEEIEAEQRRRKSRHERRVPRFDPLGPVPGDEDPFAAKYGEMIGPMGGPKRALDVEATRQINEQRTPEDGAQHASVAPWVVDLAWIEKCTITTDLIDMFWTRRSSLTFVLEPNSTCHNIPRELRACYTLGLCGWTLDIRKCPPEAREFFPNLLESCNSIEWGELPEWKKLLYYWDVDLNKYVLTDPNRAWHYEEELT